MEDWILCDEKIPEEGELVILTIKGFDFIRPEEGETLEEAINRISNTYWVTVGFMGEDGWYGGDGYPMIVNPIAWMPLPKPYEGGK